MFTMKSIIRFSILVFVILMISGAASAGPQLAPNGTGFTYQGKLIDGGSPANGSYDFQFSLFDALNSGAQVGSTLTQTGVTVTNGLFTVQLDFGNVFNGTALYLEIGVRPGGSGGAYTTLTPRQPLSPTPYALYTTQSGNTGMLNNQPASYYLNASNINSGTLSTNYFSAYADLVAESKIGTGSGQVAAGDHNHWGQTWTGSGTGLTLSGGTYGLLSNGSTYGVYGSSPNGYGVNGSSTNGTGVYGSGGTYGAYGSTYSGTGVYGSSTDGDGVYGSSTNNYGGYFVSQNFRGLYARGAAGWYGAFIVNSAGSTNAGLYVDGTLLVTGSKSGYVVDIAVNDGPESLETGDVVVLTGSADPLLGQIPLVRVRKATQAGSKAVMGVVDQPFSGPDAQSAQGQQAQIEPSNASALSAEGTAIGPGKYLSVVTLGAYKIIKVDASVTSVHVGDLLVASAKPGYAMAADDPKLGSVIGKALSECLSGTCQIPLLVTLK